MNVCIVCRCSSSVWRFAYFASTTDMAVVNAQFSTGLSLSVQQSVFATQQVFTGDVTSLVNFADLLGVALTTRVASEKFAEFTAAIQLVYDGLSEVTALGTPVVEVVAQEEYLTPAGQFVYNLLYVVKIDNQPLGPISLPRTPTLPEIALSIKAPTSVSNPVRGLVALVLLTTVHG